MLVWMVIMLLFTLISLISHLGFFNLSFLVGPWDKITLDIILLFIILGIVYRMVTLTRRAEKELLRETIKGLAKELKALKGESEEDKLIRKAQQMAEDNSN